MLMDWPDTGDDGARVRLTALFANATSRTAMYPLPDT